MTDQSGFESGSANLRADFTSLLDSVGDSLAGASGLIQIEGHTDNVAMSFGNRYRNNWDLSSARAASVADYLQDGGSIAPGSMVIKGFADTRPIALMIRPQAAQRTVESKWWSFQTKIIQGILLDR